MPSFLCVVYIGNQSCKESQTVGSSQMFLYLYISVILVGFEKSFCNFKVCSVEFVRQKTKNSDIFCSCTCARFADASR